MLARLVLLLLLPLPFSAATDGTLFTSSVTYCQPPETLLVQQFDVSYIEHNNSISFNIAAQSVDSNSSVSASILVNVYGLTPVNVTIDLCSLLGGALCPLPQYTFNGSQSLALPESLGVSNRVPGIAFRIPDLEAYAQLTLIEVGTGEVKACVQATLSNGWSTRQPGVEWGTAALALFTLLVAAWQSTNPYAVLPYRFLDLLHFYQSIAATALLSLNFPLLYRAFAVNFAWAMGLISSSSSKLQHSIDNMRALTGGHLANSSSAAAVGLIDRKISPWNTNIVTPTLSSPLTQSLLADTSANKSAPTNLRLAFGAFQQLSAVDEVQTVTDDSSNVLQAGIPIYVNSIHIATANAFMTIFLVCLIAVVIALGIVGLLYGLLYAANRFGWGKEQTRYRLKSSFPAYIRAWGLRLALIALSPIMIFVFNQWSLKDSWLSILLSVLTFLAISAAVLYPVYLTLRLARRESPNALESNLEHLATHGPLYAQYRTPRYYFFLPLLIAAFVKAVVIAAGQGSGMAQVVVFMIVELFIVAAHIVLKPYNSRGGDVFSTYLAIVRLVCTGCMIAFVESVEVAAIPRVAIGAVVAVIFSIAVIVLAINIFLHAGVNRLWRRNNDTARGPSRQGSADASMLEKGDISPIESEPGRASHSRTPSQYSVTAVNTSVTQHSTSTSTLSHTAENSIKHHYSKQPPAPFPFPTNTPNPTPHQIFHLPRNATQSDVKARYFDLVRIYHPDKVDGSVPSGVAHARFQAITAAYNALRTPSASLPGQDVAATSTPTARAMYKRSRNLYSGPQLADDSWKDRIIIAGVIFAAFCFVMQTAATRRALLEDVMARPSYSAPNSKRAAPLEHCA
ncbi:Flavin carrier protein 2 [Mycena venus]|uniref:Flavin carrier protein 2 n=1 Tax=Mycena venus TaxID=2733690 RepID=A0A8H7D5B0_9AGAR|nr:Flavin carrier protein 2 [Mycena venus]